MENYLDLGFTTFWELTMRNKDGQARADFSAGGTGKGSVLSVHPLM